MHKSKYVIMCKLKYVQICKNVQWPQKYVSFVSTCIYLKKYAKICKKCKHEIHMQNMQKYVA